MNPYSRMCNVCNACNVFVKKYQTVGLFRKKVDRLVLSFPQK